MAERLVHDLLENSIAGVVVGPDAYRENSYESTLIVFRLMKQKVYFDLLDTV